MAVYVAKPSPYVFLDKSSYSLLNKFINLIMIHGEKVKAFQILYTSLDLALKKLGNIDTKDGKGIYSGQVYLKTFSNVNNINLTSKSKGLPRFHNVNLAPSTYSVETKPLLEPIKKDRLLTDPRSASSLSLTESITTSGNSQQIKFAVFFVVQAVENVRPSLEVRRVRIGGTTYQVPAAISRRRGEGLAVRWLLESAQKRKKGSKKTFAQCLAQELLDAFKKTGGARQKRDELHKTAEMNRPFVRYSWW